jgi:hypothetical protein
MSASARGVRAEGDIGGYIRLPQWIADRVRVNEIWKRNGLPNFRRLFTLNT